MTSADDFLKLNPSELRLREASFLVDRFFEACNAEHNDTLFLMTTYFDSFLFCFVSIEEMVSSEQRVALRESNLFRFIKALRNISTHHSILTGSKTNRFPRPIARILSVGVGCVPKQNAEFYIKDKTLHEIFDKILDKRPQEKHNIPPAKKFLKERAENKERILISELLCESIELVKVVLENK